MILTPEGLATTPDVLRGVEDQLRGETGASVAIFAGRAATALYLAYLAARRPDDEAPEVILPAISCATPANCAYLAGYRPRFADVDCRTGLVTLESVMARATPRTRAVVFVHLYGQTTDLRAMAEWCRRLRIALIEDAAQALGARLPDGGHVGSVGDMAVYSFNPTKIIECGGGALVVRAPEAGERALAVLRGPLPPSAPPEQAAQLARSYRDLHHGLVGLFRLRPEAVASPLFLNLRQYYDGLYVRPLARPEALAADWGQVAEVLGRRRELAERYAEELKGGPWELLDGWRASGACWRYTLLVTPERQVELSEAVRRDGFHVSNLYWPVQQFFAPGDSCPEADRFARRAVNLWVDGQMTADRVRDCAGRLHRHAETLANSERGPR